MSDLRFTWHPPKAELNRRKHKVSFQEAQTVFLDEWAVEASDKTHSDREDRWVRIGLSQRLRLLTVIYTERNEETIHIISARRSNRAEAASYAASNGGDTR